MVGGSVTPRLALLQLTTPALWLHDQPVPLAPMYAVPAGNVSVTITLVAELGPAFETVTVYVSIPPAVTGSGKAAFVIERFATELTVVDIVDVLLVPMGSGWSGVVTLAVLTRSQPSVGALIVIVMTDDEPKARLGVVCEQVTK